VLQAAHRERAGDAERAHGAVEKWRLYRRIGENTGVAERARVVAAAEISRTSYHTALIAGTRILWPMRVNGGLVALLATSLVVLVLPVTGDSPSAAPGSLKARVVSELEDEPVASAQVVLAIPGGAVVATAESGEDGRFEISGVAEGVYDIAVTRSGFEDFADAVVVPGGAVRDLGDIVLKLDFGAASQAKASQETSWYGAGLAAGFIALAALVFFARHSRRLMTIAGKVPKGAPVVATLPPRVLPGRTVAGARRVAAMRRERVARGRNF
jgi:hypothetical protein